MSTSEIVALYDLLHFAVDNEQPVVVLYATEGTTEKARVLHPVALTSTKAGADIIRAHDSLSNETKTFRVDRIRAAHHLTA